MKGDTNKFWCFNRMQQAILRNRNGKRWVGVRVTNRCFTYIEPTMKGQHKMKRRAMTEAEVSAVYTLTGFQPFHEEKFV